MSQHPADDTEASTSRAMPPAPDVIISQPEQGLHRPGVPCTLLKEVQAEQALWQGFREHGTSLNNALTEAPRIHRGGVVPAL
jgi:hypothetical protein